MAARIPVPLVSPVEGLASVQTTANCRERHCRYRLSRRRACFGAPPIKDCHVSLVDGSSFYSVWRSAILQEEIRCRQRLDPGQLDLEIRHPVTIDVALDYSSVVGGPGNVLLIEPQLTSQAR